MISAAPAKEFRSRMPDRLPVQMDFYLTRSVTCAIVEVYTNMKKFMFTERFFHLQFSTGSQSTLHVKSAE